MELPTASRFHAVHLTLFNKMNLRTVLHLTLFNKVNLRTVQSAAKALCSFRFHIKKYMLAAMNTFAKHALVNDDGTGLTTEQRLELALRDPAAPEALKQGQVRAITQNRIRSAMAELAHGKIDKVTAWLDQVAEGVKDAKGDYLTRPNPAAAVELFMQLAEYSLPKLKAVAIDVRSSDGSVKQYSVKDLESIVSEQ